MQLNEPLYADGRMLPMTSHIEGAILSHFYKAAANVEVVSSGPGGVVFVKQFVETRGRYDSC